MVPQATVLNSKSASLSMISLSDSDLSAMSVSEGAALDSSWEGAFPKMSLCNALATQSHVVCAADLKMFHFRTLTPVRPDKYTTLIPELKGKNERIPVAALRISCIMLSSLYFCSLSSSPWYRAFFLSLQTVQ
jgi:hypothetical protein